MKNKTFDIIQLIEQNSINTLSKTYQSKLLNKIKEKMHTNEQQIFVTSFYSYLNFSKDDFVIDLDDIWQWIGFARKDNAKKTLGKFFAEPEDYKILQITDKLYEENFAPPTGEAKSLHTETYEEKAATEVAVAAFQHTKTYGEKAAYPIGEAKILHTETYGEKAAPPVGGAKSLHTETRVGQNKEQILMTIKTFKKLCLKANTKKSNEIHDYYINLEEILHETVNEESNELRLQLEDNKALLINTQNELKQEKEMSQLEKDILVEETLLQQFPENTECIYVGIIDDKDSEGSDLSKFGNTNNLRERILAHRKTYKNFRLIYAFKVKNKIQIENCIKKHSILKSRKRSIITEETDGLNHVELLSIDKKFPLEKIYKYIVEIITENEYNIENFSNLIEKYDKIEIENNKLINENKKLIVKNEKIALELEKYKPVQSQAEKNTTKYSDLAANNYYLYIFHCINNRYICNITRVPDIINRENIHKGSYVDGSIKYKIIITWPCMDKIMNFLLKQYTLCLGNDIFEGDFDNIKLVLDIVSKLENILIFKGKSLEELDKIFTNIQTNKIERLDNIFGQLENDPESASVNKSRRPVDQIDQYTNKLIASFKTLEDCGRALGCTGTNVGISLRNNKLCKGYIVRYTGISQEDQYKDQPVVKINCNTGDKIYFANLASAGKDSNITYVALRNRINTNVHVGNYHWIWDIGATHYKNK